MKEEGSNGTKPFYEKPVVLKLDEINGSKGDCGPGSGDSFTCLENGNHAGGACSDGITGTPQ
jgi:hypothetical protein